MLRVGVLKGRVKGVCVEMGLLRVGVFRARALSVGVLMCVRNISPC